MDLHHLGLVQHRGYRVPQGSILGPLMFLLFVNGIPQITLSNIMLFADDTKLWRLIKSIDDVNILQEDLAKIIEWCQKWKLHLNVKKCKYIGMTTYEL